MKLRIAFKGGSGSGHFGHQGRPGLVGGSRSGSHDIQSIIRDTYDRMIDYKRSEGSATFSEQEIELLKPLRMKKTTNLYRGLRLSPFRESQLYGDIENNKLSVGDTITITESQQEAWTSDRATAEMFMISNGTLPRLSDKGLLAYYGGGVNLVLERQFQPDETIIDFNNWYDHLKQDMINNLPMFGTEGEVVVSPGTYTYKIITIMNESGLHRFDDFTMPTFKWP